MLVHNNSIGTDQSQSDRGMHINTSGRRETIWWAAVAQPGAHCTSDTKRKYKTVACTEILRINISTGIEQNEPFKEQENQGLSMTVSKQRG